MNRRAFAVAVFGGVSLGLPAARAAAQPTSPVTIPMGLGGIAIGSSITSLVGALGFPTAVASSDVGHRWEWSTNGTALIAISDGDGKVLAVDYAPAGAGQPLVIDVDGTSRTLTFGSYRLADAQAQLSTISDVTPPTGPQLFRLSATRELALFFDSRNVLTRAILGDRLTLARLGYLPGENTLVEAFAYKAPRAKTLLRLRPSPAPASAPHAVILRIEVGTDGSVAEASIFVSSGDAAFDRAAVKAVLAQTFIPATLSGKQIPATMFSEVKT